MNSPKAGFTIAEVFICAILITTLVTGTLQMLSQGGYLVERSRDNTRITQILQSEIEDMRTLNWNDLAAMKEWDTFTPEGKFTSAYASEFYCYRQVTTLSTDQKEVLVIAVWYDSRSRAQVSFYRTRFTKEGLNDYYYRAV